jgi:hypothetical protein
MTSQLFTSTITKWSGKTIIPIPFNPHEIWGHKQRHHITGSVNGHKYRGPISENKGKFFLSLGEAWCRDSGLVDGTQVDVTLSPEGPQVDQLPEDIVQALDAEPQAKSFFVSLATFYRKGYLNWIKGARRPETRQSRINEMVALLNEGKKQR